MSTAPTDPQCPVLFCGTPKASAAFDTFFANTEKQSGIAASQVASLNQIMEKTKDLDHGIVLMLFATKNDLVPIVNSLTTLKKRIDKGVVRAIVYSLADHAKTKIPGVLKTKGCTEMLVDGLTQKALVHKLQRHVQIIGAKYKAEQDKLKAAKDTVKIEGKKVDSASAEKGKLKFVAALSEPSDTWLVKNKKDFRFVQNNWIGEMIGPGPSAGSWIEAGGTKSQPVHRWTPRDASGPNPFVGTNGAWFCAGRKPEFDWKVNRWRFVGETPSLFFKPSAEGAAMLFRFRSVASGTLEVALNSAPAKAKLKAMIETFSEEKTFKEEKKKPQTEAEIALEKEKKKKAGDYNDKLTEDEKPADWGNKLTEDEDPDEWGELKEGEEEAAAAVNDRTGEGEEEKEHDWSGLDIGKGNKFNSGRGVGQGDKDGNKGYKPEEDKAFAREKNEGSEIGDKRGEDDDKPRDANDRTGEGAEENPHDWSGLDVGRGNKFESGRGLGQGTGEKGYKYDKDGNKVPLAPGESDEGPTADAPGAGAGEDGAEADDPFNLDEIGGGKKKGGGAGAESKRRQGEDAPAKSAEELELDAILGNPAEDTEWESGESAFEKITLDIVAKRGEGTAAVELKDITLLERQENDLLLDAPAAGYKAGEPFVFAIQLGQPAPRGKKGRTNKKLEIAGILKSAEPSEESREIILVTVADRSRAHLTEIQNVFDLRQEQLLKFLREAKG